MREDLELVMVDDPCWTMGMSFMAEWLIFLHFQTDMKKNNKDLKEKTSDMINTWSYLKNPWHPFQDVQVDLLYRDQFDSFSPVSDLILGRLIATSWLSTVIYYTDQQINNEFIRSSSHTLVELHPKPWIWTIMFVWYRLLWSFLYLVTNFDKFKGRIFIFRFLRSTCTKSVGYFRFPFDFFESFLNLGRSSQSSFGPQLLIDQMFKEKLGICNC